MGLTSKFLVQALVMLALLISLGYSDLSPNYYAKTCPKALSTIKRVVNNAVAQESRMGASLLRLHFHDCFVNGCDGSVLLDDTATIDGEKNANPNRNSARGFNIIDLIKTEVEKVCKGVVSCADILTVASRDSVVALGGPSWTVPLGRRDSLTASRAKANSDLPSPFLDLQGLLTSFSNQGLDQTDLVALSGGHVVGFSKCGLFKNRIYNETNIDPVFANARKKTCPSSGGDLNLAPLDPTAAKFDTAYFTSLTKRRGLLHTDQVLFNGGSTDSLVKRYSADPSVFNAAFVKSMIKMGNIKPLTGSQGQIRLKCSKIN